MSRLKILPVTSVAGVALLAASVSGVLAARGPGQQVGHKQGAIGYGTLSTISTGSATIATPNNGNLTVNLAPQATYTARSQGAATAGLKAGDQVAVRGSSLNGTVTARSVDYDTVAFAVATGRYTGTVSTSSSSALTLTTSNGQSITVGLASTTRYMVNGAASSTKPSFNSNQQVRVSAAQYTDGTLVAQLVTIPPATAAAPSATATISP